MRMFLAALVLLAGPAAAQDNSRLEELTTRDDLRGFEPVGRVDIDNGGFCTGALIAADLVLTAAHCVLDPDGSPVDAGRITFRAGFSRGSSLAEVPVARTSSTRPTAEPTLLRSRWSNATWPCCSWPSRSQAR